MATKMYAHPRYLDQDFEVPLPKCMYKTEIINTNAWFDNGPDLVAMSEDNRCDTKNPNCDDDAARLLQRQEKILLELEMLQKKVHDLSKAAGVAPQSQKNLIGQNIDQKLITPHSISLDEDLDIVITAMPSKAPICAFVLLHLLRQRGIRIISASHVHSSVKETMPESLHCLAGSVQKLDVEGCTLTVRFIWKEDPFGPSLIVSPRAQTPIKGDANIARYLCRKFAPDLYEELNEAVISRIDHWTFIAFSKILNGTDLDTKEAFEEARKQIDNGNWLADKSISLADVVVWAAICTSKKSSSIPGTMKRWFQNCNKTFTSVSAYLYHQ